MAGATDGAVRGVLRLEALSVLIGTLLAYSRFGLGWKIFAIFFFTPDVSFLGYLGGARIGCACYNLAHSYIGASICLLAGVFFSAPIVLGAGIIWCAHIGFDRALGYGLKYSAGFGFTHLGRIGAKPKDP